MHRKPARAGNGVTGIIAMGIILVLLGVPFVGMTVMTVMLISGELKYGLPGAIVILTAVFLISDFTGALAAAAGAGSMAVCLRWKLSLSSSVAVASALTAIAVMLGTALLPEASLFSRGNLQALARVYGSAGMSPGEIALAMNLLHYLLPVLLSLWAITGVIASGAAARMLAMRRGTWPEAPDGEPFRLGLLPAWVLITALAVNLAGDGLPPALRRAAVNVCLFMVLPYTAAGVAVCRKFLSLYPQSLLLLLLAAVIFPPVALGILAMTGLLDTWLDLRARMDIIKERN